MGHEEVALEDDAGGDDAQMRAKRAQMMVRARLFPPLPSVRFPAAPDGHPLTARLLPSRSRLSTQERLNAIDESRRADAEARRAEADGAADPRENVRAFLASFESDRAEVERSVLEARDAGEKGRGPDDLRPALDAALSRTLAMERRVAEASYFLPSYDARACAAAVERLKGVHRAAAADLLPRKKFAFSSKRKKKASAGDDPSSDLPPPAPAAAAAAPTPPVSSAAASSVLAKIAAMELHADASAPGARDVVGGDPLVVRGALGADAASAAPDCVLERLADCDVFLIGTFRALRCHDLANVRVFGGPVLGSALLHGLTRGCRVEIAAAQCRVHDARDGAALYLRTSSRPIIEHSSDVAFAPFAFEYPGLGDALERAGLGADAGTWREVDDFGWIKTHRASPNWRVLEEGERTPAPSAPPSA